MSHWVLAALLGLGLGSDGARELDEAGEPFCRVADLLPGTGVHSVDEVYPRWRKDPRWGRLFAGAHWVDARAWTQGDLGVVQLVLYGERRPPAVTVPLMVPPPLKGTLTLQLRTEGRRWCANALVEQREDESLHTARIRLPATLSIQLTRGDGTVSEWSVRASEAWLSSYDVHGLGAGGFYIGDPGSLPDEYEPVSPDFRSHLLKAGVKPEEALRSSLGPSWDRTLFAIVLSDLEGWRPGALPALERLVRDLDPARFKGAQRRALGYWKGTFAPARASGPSPGTVTLVPSSDSSLITLAIPGRILAKGAGGKRLAQQPVKVEIPPGRLLRLLGVTSTWSVSGPQIELRDDWIALAPGERYDVDDTRTKLEGRGLHAPHRDCVSVTFEDPPGAEWEIERLGRYRSGQVAAPDERWGSRQLLLHFPRDPDSVAEPPPRKLSYEATHDGTYSFVVKKSGEITGSFEPDRVPCR